MQVPLQYPRPNPQNPRFDLEPTERTLAGNVCFVLFVIHTEVGLIRITKARNRHHLWPRLALRGKPAVAPDLRAFPGLVRHDFAADELDRAIGSAGDRHVVRHHDYSETLLAVQGSQNFEDLAPGFCI